MGALQMETKFGGIHSVRCNGLGISMPRLKTWQSPISLAF